MSDIDDLRYTATMAALQAERAFLEVELAEMEPKRHALQDRIEQIDQAMATGVPIEPGFSYSRSPKRVEELRPREQHVAHDLLAEQQPAPAPEGRGRRATPPPQSMRPLASAPSSPPRAIIPLSEQAPAMATVAGPVDPLIYQMGVGPNGDMPPRAPVADPDDPAFLAQMRRVAEGDDGWLDDPRYAPGPEHTDPYKRQVGE